MGDPKIEQLIQARLQNPDEALLEKARALDWTSHNIPLTLSESTLGPDQPLIGDDTRMRAIKDCLRSFSAYRGGLSGLRSLDLGCLEGGLSFEMAREGANAFGVEGREQNVAKCEFVRALFQLPNLDFAHLDVKDLDPGAHGVFDIVLCCGLLYHLDDPVGFLEQLESLTHDETILFLDTHVSPDDSQLEHCFQRENLGPIETIERKGQSYEGRWFREFSTDEERESSRWTAVSNPTSFWLSEKSLVEAVYRSGFNRIFNVIGSFPLELEQALRKEYSRVFFVAVKDGYFKAVAEGRRSKEEERRKTRRPRS